MGTTRKIHLRIEQSVSGPKWFRNEEDNRRLPACPRPPLCPPYKNLLSASNDCLAFHEADCRFHVSLSAQNCCHGVTAQVFIVYLWPERIHSSDSTLSTIKINYDHGFLKLCAEPSGSVGEPLQLSVPTTQALNDIQSCTGSGDVPSFDVYPQILVASLLREDWE